MTSKILKEHKDKLKGFKDTNVSKGNTIQVGDFVKYFVDNELRYGGYVKFNGYPKYIVLANYKKNVSWSVQYTQPTLKLFVKTKQVIAKERTARQKLIRKLLNEHQAKQ